MDGNGDNHSSGEAAEGFSGSAVGVMARLLAEFEGLALDEQLVRMGTGGALLERLLALDLDATEDAALVEAVAAANRISACAESVKARAAGVLAERAAMNPPALAVSTTAGYAFGRLRWRGRDAVFLLFLVTLMVPQEVLVVPMFQLMQWFGWVDTPQALILPFAFTAFGTFLMRQFFRGIPYELEEASRVDGAGPLRAFGLIILPLARSAVAVLTVFTFIAFWNSYLWPLIIVNDYNYLGTLPIGLATFSGQFGTRWDLQMAASIISMVPTAILVIVLQKHLVRGIATAGIAGR